MPVRAARRQVTSRGNAREPIYRHDGESGSEKGRRAGVMMQDRPHPFRGELGFIFVAVLLIGTSCAMAAQRVSYPDRQFVVSPYPGAEDAYLNTIYNRPYESKGLSPVKLTLRDDVPPLVLCENGRPRAKIVTLTDNLYYNEIAELLKEYLDLATGASFEIVDDGDSMPRGIYVGPLRNATSQEVFREAQTRGLDHFIVQSFDKGIILAGKDADPLHNAKRNLPEKYQRIRTRNALYVRGTYFAAIDFLERLIGIRRYSPGRVGAYIPDLTTRKVVIPAVRYEDGPVFAYRGWGGAHYGNDARYLKVSYKEGDLWASYRRRSKATLAIGNHTDCYWHEFYAEEHPDYFAMRTDGTRMMGRKGPQSSQRCYTNEAGFQQHLENIDNWYKHGDRTGREYRTFTRDWTTPNDKYIYWMPNDGFPGCFCPGCKALLAKYDAKYHPQLVQELHYAAKLAREMKKRWPGKVLNYDLYGRKDIPAEFGLPDNVSITKVFNSYCEAYWKERKYLDFARALIDKLNTISIEKALIWSHYPVKPRQMTDLDMPYPAPHVLSRFYRESRDDILGVYINLGPWVTWAHDTYILYLYQSILWNPDVDPDEVLGEFCSLMFGPARKEMKEYHDLLIDRWENVKWSYTPDVVIYGGEHLSKTMPKKLYWTETYPRPIRDKLESLLRVALAKTEPGTIYHERMQHYTEAASRFFQQGRDADEGREMTAECPRISRAVTIDGDLREWQGAEALLLKESMTGRDAKIRTEFFTAHDETHFCVAGRAHEPSGIVLPPDRVARLHEYDSVEVFVCPDQLGDDEGGFNKRGRFYQIILNARGDTMTVLKPLGKKPQVVSTLSFDRAVKPMGKGFQFEAGIPYASIDAIPPKPGSQWGANFYRNRKRDDGSERYYAWSPTMGKPFFKTETFGTLRFPKELLFAVDFRVAAAWDKRAPTAEYSYDFRDGVGIMRVKYPASSDKPTVIGFYTRSLNEPITKPIRVSTSIRYNGVGVSKIDFYVRSKSWEKMEYSYNPSANPREHIQTEAWRYLTVDRAVKRSREGKADLDKINDFYSAGVAATMHPGAEFTLEVKKIRARAR